MAWSSLRGMLRAMQPKIWYSRSGATARRLILAALLPISVWLACSDDKPQHSDKADESSGGESFKARVNSAHEQFKQDIRPAAGWVDEKSHRVVDEAEDAVHKGKQKLDGDDGDRNEGEDAHDHDPHDHDHDGVHDTTGAATNGD